MPLVPSERINIYSKAAYVKDDESDSDDDDEDQIIISKSDPADDHDEDYAQPTDVHQDQKRLLVVDGITIPYKTSKKRKPTSHLV